MALYGVVECVLFQHHLLQPENQLKQQINKYSSIKSNPTKHTILDHKMYRMGSHLWFVDLFFAQVLMDCVGLFLFDLNFML